MEFPFRRLALVAGTAMLFQVQPLFADGSNAQALPVEVQADLLKDQLAQKLKAHDDKGIVELIPKFRALNIALPDSLYYVDARSLYNLGRALEARDQLVIYLRKTGRNGTYYDEATKLLLAVQKAANAEEKQQAVQEATQKKELAQRVAKARMLQIRYVQRNLAQLGFHRVDETGELNKPTREAIAVYQVRNDLQVNGEVTQETFDSLKAAVPDTQRCDTDAAYPRKPEQVGIAIDKIAAQDAIQACNQALRKYPGVIRFQVEYARALLAADRNSDAMDALKNSAQLGYPGAQTLLGWMYEHGRLSKRGRPDFDTALHWYKLAAAQDYPEAILSIGRFYLEGAGELRRNSETAAQYYSRAANLGYPPAETALGELYQDGRGVSRDYRQAADWFSRAAKSGFAAAEYRLGRLYERGDGVARNKDTAIDWYRRASNSGNAKAQERLKWLGG